MLEIKAGTNPRRAPRSKMVDAIGYFKGSLPKLQYGRKIHAYQVAIVVLERAVKRLTSKSETKRKSRERKRNAS